MSEHIFVFRQETENIKEEQMFQSASSDKLHSCQAPLFEHHVVDQNTAGEEFEQDVTDGRANSC